MVRAGLGLLRFWEEAADTTDTLIAFGRGVNYKIIKLFLLFGAAPAGGRILNDGEHGPQ